MSHPPLSRSAALGGLLFAGLLVLTHARAEDVRTFSITGEVIADCGFDSAAVTFDLGNVEVASLPSVGSASDWVAGALVSTGCAGLSSITMALRGTADADDTGLFAATGGAGGIGIELGTADGQTIVPNGPGVTWLPQPAGGTYMYRARYVRTSAPLQVGPGAATITVSIEHE